jgi:hypothetical protein
VKKAVKLWYESLRKEFWVVKCGNTVYDVKCVHKSCHCEYMLVKVDVRVIEFVLSLWSTIVALSSCQNSEI